MYLKLDHFYADLLKRIAERDREPTATAAMRTLIREAAKARGLWPTATAEEAEAQPASN